MMSVVDVMFDPNNGLKVTERPKALADRMVGLWEMISEVSENLPPATLRWRIQNWLAVGQGRVERGLGDMKVRAFVQRTVVLVRMTHSEMWSRGGGGESSRRGLVFFFFFPFSKKKVLISPRSHQFLLVFGTGK